MSDSENRILPDWPPALVEACARASALYENCEWDADWWSDDWRAAVLERVMLILTAAVAYRDEHGTPALYRNEEWEHWFTQIAGAELTRRAETAEAERDALREALRTYGLHTPACVHWGPYRYPQTGCTCGLAALLEAG